MAALRAALFYFGISLFTVLIVGLAPLFFPFPYMVRHRYMNLWARFVIFWLRTTCGLGYEVIGRENIPKDTAIIMAKHQSAWETIAMQLIFPPHTWVLKRELLLIPFFGWGLILMRAIPIDRSSGKRALKQVIEQGIDRLQSGLSVVIFPEGTRMAPGEHGKYAIGGAMLATKSGYPVVPVAHNAGLFWPKSGFLKKPGTITLVIGEAIDPTELKPAELNGKVETWIESESARLIPAPLDPSQ